MPAPRPARTVDTLDRWPPAAPAAQRRRRPGHAIEAIRALASADHADTSVAGIVLTAGTAVFEPVLGLAKRRLGARLGSAATAGEGTQNLLCGYLAAAVLAGLLANTLFGVWWLDGAVALAISAWAVAEGRRAWAGRGCGCGCQPDPRSLPFRSPSGRAPR